MERKFLQIRSMKQKQLLENGFPRWQRSGRANPFIYRTMDSGNKISKQITKIKNNQKNRIYEKGNIYRLHRYHGGTISQKE
jgi:hypothetical protein